MTTSNTSNMSRSHGRISRRAVLASATFGTPLLLFACTNDDPAKPMPIIETPTPAPTQAEPTPTQPPIASPVPGYLDKTRWKGRTITVATATTGSIRDSMVACFFDAFARDTGAIVKLEEFGRDAASNIAAQINNGRVLWDVMLVPMTDVLPWSNQRLLSAIDYNVVDNTYLYPELALQHGVGAMMYSTTMMYSVSEQTPPKTWAEFFDVSRWSGTRALRRSPIGTLEFALMADGVPMDDLYPLDLERAFRKLDTIRQTTLFYEDSKQPVEMVRTGQAGLASSWTVRTILPEVASLVKPVWNGGMISADSWVIPRGTDHLDVAMSFVNYCTRSVPTANFSRSEPFGPVNKGALGMLRPDVVKWLPNNPDNLTVQFFENWSYWRDQTVPVTAQFEDWLLHPDATPLVSPAAVSSDG